jgi:phosphate uptake regulator
MENPRKIQLTGRNTYTVSLPHEWIKKLGVGKGDPVYIVDNGDETITLSTKKAKKEERRYTISVSEGAHTIMRNIVSAYIAGAGTIVLRGKETSTIAERVRYLLSGVEIVGEGEEEITLTILNFENLDVDNVLKREFNVTKTMFGLVCDACRGRGNALEISKREEEVDRLYILLLRELVMSATPQKEAVFKAVVAKSIEKVGDHLVDLSKSAADAGTNEWLAGLVEDAGDVYTQAFEAFAKNEPDSGKFRAAIARYKDAYQKTDAVLRRVKDTAKAIILLVLLEKCNKIIRYSEDIMESNTDIIFMRMDGGRKAVGHS